MGRPPHPIGVSGKVRSYRTATGWRSRTTVRDLDGRTREVQRTGRTRAASERNLAIAVRDRSQVNPSSSITPETRVSVLAEVWFAEITSLDRSPSTLDAYRARLNAQILPALGELRVRELTVGRVDRFLASVKATHGPSLAKMTRSVLSGVCGLACRHDALGHNPCRDVVLSDVRCEDEGVVRRDDVAVA